MIIDAEVEELDKDEYDNEEADFCDGGGGGEMLECNTRVGEPESR